MSSEPASPLPISKVHRYNTLFERGRYQEALEGFLSLLGEPNGVTMHANVGYCYRALGEHQDAVRHFEAYLEEFPFRQHAWKAMSYCCYELKDYEGMTKSAREAIKWDIQKGTFDDYPWQQLATAHFLVNDLSTCLKAARKALGINPHNAFAAYYESCALFAIAQGAELDEPELLPERPTREEATLKLALALKLRPALEEDVLSEGHVSALLTEALAQVPHLNDLTRGDEISPQGLEGPLTDTSDATEELPRPDGGGGGEPTEGG